MIEIPGLSIFFLTIWENYVRILSKEVRMMRRNLYQVRKNLGIPRTAMAKSLGVSDVLIYYWECGKRRPPVYQVQKLSGLLGVEAAELLRPIV